MMRDCSKPQTLFQISVVGEADPEGIEFVSKPSVAARPLLIQRVKRRPQPSFETGSCSRLHRQSVLKRL